MRNFPRSVLAGLLILAGCGTNPEEPGVARSAMCVGGGYPIRCPGTRLRACPDLCPDPGDGGGGGGGGCGPMPALPYDPELGSGWSVHAPAGGPRNIEYSQLAAQSKYNSRDCVSGCGGTAWAMLAAWIDYRERTRAISEKWDTGRWLNDFWITTSYGRSYQSSFATDSASTDPATLVQNGNYDDTWSRLTGGFADVMSSQCIGDQAFTEPRNMPSGGDYVKSWGARVVSYSDYELAPDHVNTGRYLADVRSWIDTYQTPVILGFNELADGHYDLVVAYARKASWVCSSGSWTLTESDPWKMRVDHGWGDDAVWDDPPAAAWAAYTIVVAPPDGPVTCADGSVGPELYQCPACTAGEPGCNVDTVGTVLPFCGRQCCAVSPTDIPCCVHPGHGVGC